MSSARGGGAREGASSDIGRIEEANRQAGQHFFEPATMRFFNSTVFPRVYGGRYFITSERLDEHHPERFTIRVAFDDGSVQTIGEFRAFDSHEDAVLGIGRLL